MDRSWEYINRSQTHECVNWNEAAQFPEKEYINWIFLAVWIEGWMAKIRTMSLFNPDSSVSKSTLELSTRAVERLSKNTTLIDIVLA